METQRKIKHEDRLSVPDVKPELDMNQSQVDYNRLYGDLCRKLLSTPVGEIFPEVITGSTSKQTISSTGNTSPNSIHPAFPAFSTLSPTPLSYMPAIYSPDQLLMMAGGHPHGLNIADTLNSGLSEHPLGGASSKNGFVEMRKNPSISPGSDVSFDNMENVDVQKLVDEFRVTLERFGVSQRFAARFIMQDTSQGNLSFLMEKGRNKKWEELSPRGRLPYIKMKAWLESKEQQMATLEMLKYSQESKKNSTRESYNRRERFSMFQLNVLCRLFEENSNPPMNIRNAVAMRLGIPLDRVNVWFQNQRARGFPARKVLQQSLYENEGDPYLAIDVENMKDKINEANFVPQNIPVNMLNMDSPTYRKSSEQGLCKKPSPKPNVYGSPIQAGLMTSVKSEPNETVLPLDLSSSSFSDKRLSTAANSLPTIAQSSHNSPENLDFETNKITANQSGYQTTTAVNSGTSGAAKRKRGSKPQQIIPMYKKETYTNNESEKLNESKRRKVSDVVSPESKYTYLLDTSDIEPDNLSQNSYQSNGYDYVIKSETHTNGNSVNTSPENTKLYQLNENSLGESSHNEQKQYKESETNSGAYNFTFNTKDLKSTKTESLNPKSIELFKAMCASLAVKDQRKSDTNLNEPELD